MTGAAILILVMKGAGDRYLTESPAMTFFRSGRKQTTRYSYDDIYQSVENYNPGSSTTVTINRAGDLLHDMLLRVEVPATGSADHKYIKNMSHAFIEKAELILGNTPIYTHHDNESFIKNQLTMPDSRHLNKAYSSGAYEEAETLNAKTVHIPLRFGLGTLADTIPLIALQFHAVKIKFHFAKLDRLYYRHDTSSPPTSYAATKDDFTVGIISRQIYLDTPERTRFSEESHEYVIQQVQSHGDHDIAASTKKQIDLQFNHPTAALIWVLEPADDDTDTANEGQDRLQYLRELDSCQIYLNNQKLSSASSSGDMISKEYWTEVQPHLAGYHVPQEKNIYMYSFALKWYEDGQHAGSINLSRLDRLRLDVSPSSSGVGQLQVYALSYNVLVIRDGVSGPLFAN